MQLLVQFLCLRALAIELLDPFARSGFLLGVMKEDDGAILLAEVGTLTAEAKGE